MTSTSISMPGTVNSVTIVVRTGRGAGKRLGPDAVPLAEVLGAQQVALDAEHVLGADPASASDAMI